MNANLNNANADDNAGHIEWVRSSNDPTTFYYMAETPGPEKDPLGKPAISLWVSDKGGTLQLGTHWAPDAEALEQLRTSLARQFGIDSFALRLSPAPATLDKVVLSIGDGQSSFSDLATSTASGFPPYTAIFNLALSAKHRAWAAAALTGGKDRLVVTYRGTFPVAVSVETSIEGDVKADLALLGKKPALADCAAQIDTALAAKRLQLKQTASAETPDDLKLQADRLARDKAALVLQQMAQAALPTQPTASASASMLKATASLTGKVSRPFARATDVSTWFPKGDGATYVHASPVSLPEPVEPVPTPPLLPPVAKDKDTVRLGFDPKDAPIALVQASRGEASATLRSPDFKPNLLSGGGVVLDTKQPLAVTTRYTVFGRPYDATVSAPAAEGWVLTPADLGLAKITLDGSARRDANAKEVQIHVRYVPAGRGTEDERIVTLKGIDWSATWFVVTRSAGLDGILEYDWKEATATGSVTSFPSATTDKPDLRL